ncbi:MAG: LysR substrate-binding domain-containing protein [Holophaga sp.]|nr:LysR substrate-binding domain-containing protein [Holophaga sp.]
MELRHLRYFQVIAELENFSKAAQRLHIAQPALSKRMQDLEAELGLTLFERRGRGIRLSQAGRYYQEEIRQVLERIEAAGKQARQIERGEVGSLRLAVLESLSLTVPIPRLLQELRARHPGLHLKLVGMPSLVQYEAIRARTIDAGFIAHRPFVDPDVHGLPVMDIPIHAMVPSRHPLAARPTLHLKDLENLDFIWPEVEASTSYWNLFREAFEGKAWQPRVVQEASSYITTTSLVAAGYGCALGISVPGVPVLEGIVQIPILDLDLHLHVELVWHKDNPSPALQRFLELARTVLTSAIPDAKKTLI